ncbi:MAG TPA: hypothetical protein VMD29_10625, partial [Terracidiphilus sp.]|nr:hypothetical protein [Terracidiphilus sp.]
PFLTFVSLRYYSSSLRDTFYAGKVTVPVCLSQCTGSSGGNLVCQSVNGVVYASAYSGSDCGQKIVAALAALGTGTGVVWVDSACGLTITNGSPAAPIVVPAGDTLHFNTGSFTLGTVIALEPKAVLEGQPTAEYASSTTLTEADNTASSSIPMMVLMTDESVVKDILLNGNATQQNMPSLCGGGTVSFWKANTSYSVGTGTYIQDYNGNCQKVTTSGTSGPIPPQWATSGTTPDGPIFALTSVASSSGSTAVYAGSITGGGSNAYAGLTFVISGFGNSANNGSYTCSASTATTLTLSNASASAQTQDAVATEQSVVWTYQGLGLVADVLFVNGADRPRYENATITGAVRDDIHETNYPQFHPDYYYSASSVIIDTNGCLEKVTSAGTSGSGVPSWPGLTGGNCSQGTPTTSGGVTFTSEGSGLLGLLGSSASVIFNPYTGTVLGSAGFCCAQRGPHLLVNHAGRDGLFAERGQDDMSRAEFDGNGRDGVHGEDTSVQRFALSDFGTNGRYGAISYTTASGWTSSVNIEASGWIINSSQFNGNNYGDFVANGSNASTWPLNGGHTLTGNQFAFPNIGAGGFGPSVSFLDAGGNVVTGNVFGQPISNGQKYTYDILAQKVALSSMASSIYAGNTFDPTSWTTAAASPYSTDQVGPNSDGITSQIVLPNNVGAIEGLTTSSAAQTMLYMDGANNTNLVGNGNIILRAGNQLTNGCVMYLSDFVCSSGVQGQFGSVANSGGSNVWIPAAAASYVGSNQGGPAMGMQCTTGSITPSGSAGGTATGTCTLAASAGGHPGFASATDGSVQGGLIPQVSVSGTTATVTVTTVTAGTYTAKSYNVTVF